MTGPAEPRPGLDCPGHRSADGTQTPFPLRLKLDGPVCVPVERPGAPRTSTLVSRVGHCTAASKRVWMHADIRLPISAPSTNTSNSALAPSESPANLEVYEAAKTLIGAEGRSHCMAQISAEQ